MDLRHSYSQTLTLLPSIELDNNVAVLQIFPGISTATVKAFLSPPLRGIVLESFGAGNISQREDVFEVIKEACDRGVVIVNITQCTKGSVLAYCKYTRSGYVRQWLSADEHCVQTPR